jgi:hypothetical protein
LIRDIINFVQTCCVEIKTDEIVIATPPYEVTAELAVCLPICYYNIEFADHFFTQENIKSVVIAVLLSPKLQAYKGDAPKDGVLVRELRPGLIFLLII